jgi:ABC-type Mn2+/Zn2+ transport system ATPase subunit
VAAFLIALLNCLFKVVGDLVPEEGHVRVLGAEAEGGPDVGYVPQQLGLFEVV